MDSDSVVRRDNFYVPLSIIATVISIVGSIGRLDENARNVVSIERGSCIRFWIMVGALKVKYSSSNETCLEDEKKVDGPNLTLDRGYLNFRGGLLSGYHRSVRFLFALEVRSFLSGGPATILLVTPIRSYNLASVSRDTRSNRLSLIQVRFITRSCSPIGDKRN